MSSSRRDRDGTPVTDEVASPRVRHRRHAPHEPVPIRAALQAEHPRTLAPCPPSRPGAPHAPSPWRLPGRDLNRDVIGREPPQSRGGSEQAPGGAGRAGRSALTRDVVFGFEMPRHGGLWQVPRVGKSSLLAGLRDPRGWQNRCTPSRLRTGPGRDPRVGRSAGLPPAGGLCLRAVAREEGKRLKTCHLISRYLEGHLKHRHTEL